MKIIVSLLAICCLLISGSIGPLFPWLNFIAVAGFTGICGISGASLSRHNPFQ